MAPAQQGHSEACCTVPPVSADYKEKGSYFDLNVSGTPTKTYRTGKQDSKTGILFVYDIFGYYPQTLQGADILGQEHQVFMPDFFHGKPYPISMFPPDNDERQKAFGEFFSGPANLPATKDKIPVVIDELNKIAPGIEKWGVVGFCWGGKIVSLTSGEGTKFSAAAECHPAMVDPEEAKNIKIPIAMLGSKDESAEDLEKFKNNLTSPNHVEQYKDQVHGWMAARAELTDSRVEEEYKRGYQTLLDFFHKHL